MHPLFPIVLADLRIDARQMVEEGHDPAALEQEIAAAAATGSLDALTALQQQLWHRPSPAGFGYDEPSDWDGIAATLPSGHRQARPAMDEPLLADKLHAAWLGRCIGCQLGKPFEGAWPPEVKQFCQAVGSWPLADYPNPVGDAARLAELSRADGHGKRIARAQHLARGRFDCVAPDDDIQYSICGLVSLERHGLNFTTEQAIDTILGLTPQSMLFAAGLSMVRKFSLGFRPPLTAMYGNPCRQSLGAQIRCDPFGWVCPGNPALAAELAWRDGRGSQIRNGIYSGMFFAALMADVLAHGDAAAAIDTAGQYIPPRSRFAEMVQRAQQACCRHDDWEQALTAIYERYDQDVYAPHVAPMNHSLINAAIVVLALIKGRGDFTRTIGISVMAGRDTDCNGATAGSILGCALGTSGIPAQWSAPLHDTVRTELAGMPTLSISDLARRTCRIARMS